MHLLSNDEADAPDALYGTVKLALSACELHGGISVSLLAANVLIALYEFGQGLFPAAYFSTAHCCRMVYAMGLHDRKTATQLAPKPDTWTESEEQRRLWWAVLMLDRYIHVGFRFRPLAAESIAANELLPGTDADWDQGELSVNPLLVMSIEAATRVSPFARACQAAHLLGKACRHANDHATIVEVEFHFQEAQQLIHALRALMTMISNEALVIEKSHTLFAARGLCYSALLLLYDLHSCVEVDHVEAVGSNTGLRLQVQQFAIDAFKVLIADIVGFAKQLREHVASRGMESVPPFVLQCLYSSAATYAWYFRETGKEDHLSCLAQLRVILGQLQCRWPVAREYLELLKGTETVYDGANFQ
ncbi:hypothetical protein LTR37_006465 [Vermiconidia calcicola]|uniref:Uncharacterized protein n=1 Tax=Vermiconidia calcicola TaxID=1690605 RepID=A0ACC3NGB2_9PEZI|nr:hypothetical protein LTR37_006465 [Vermiconidia calcicola]